MIKQGYKVVTRKGDKYYSFCYCTKQKRTSAYTARSYFGGSYNYYIEYIPNEWVEADERSYNKDLCVFDTKQEVNEFLLTEFAGYINYDNIKLFECEYVPIENVEVPLIYPNTTKLASKVKLLKQIEIV